jgi:hypothetical protein
MAVNIANHLPIISASTISGNAEKIQHFPEGAGKTFLGGTPVTVTAGVTTAWNGTTILTPAIMGITLLPGLNLGSAGLGAAAQPFGQIGFPGGPTLSGYPVPNQPLAVNVAHGAPFQDGTTTVVLAVPDTIFEFQVDASTGATYNATTALVGTQIGLTVDANGSWYADLAKVTAGSNTVITVTSLNPQDFVSGSSTTQINNGRIRGVFNLAVSQAQGA